MTDLFETQPDGTVKVRITESAHLTLVGEFFGAAVSLELLKENESKFGKLPGYHSAIALIEGRVADLKVKAYVKNMRLAAKAGVDLQTMTVRLLDLDTVTCVPIDEIERDEAEAKS